MKSEQECVGTVGSDGKDSGKYTSPRRGTMRNAQYCNTYTTEYNAKITIYYQLSFHKSYYNTARIVQLILFEVLASVNRCFGTSCLCVF